MSHSISMGYGSAALGALLGAGAAAAMLLAASGPAPGAEAGERERAAAVSRPTTDFTKAEAFELNPGGAATTRAPRNASAFSQPSGNMSFERQFDFKVGDGVFRKLWVSSPSSTTSSDGLGPLYNARSCQSCHLKDGRGRPPGAGEEAVSLLLALSIPPRHAEEAAAIAGGMLNAVAEPTYGAQLQNFSVQGLAAEGRPVVTYEERAVMLADGTQVSLRKPTYRVENLSHGPMHPEAMMSPRIAPPMIGMGLLEAIPEADILAGADPQDADGDGISGRANRVWDARRGAVTLGRFGWKAGQPDIAHQTAAAFAKDMGISSPLLPAGFGDCTEAQAACRGAPDGRGGAEEAEIPQRLFDLVVFYARNLGVPERPDVEGPQVLAGKKLFYDSGCTGCHTPKFVTRRDTDEVEQSFQLIWPYSDLLLHDMGEGLADNRPEGQASGREWRTAPLWGLGLTETVSGHEFLLHDGRARGLLEAILWHGGEAQAARERVAAMPRADREALLAFLRSL